LFRELTELLSNQQFSFCLFFNRKAEAFHFIDFYIEINTADFISHDESE